MLQKISSRQHQILKLLLGKRSGMSIDEIAKALDISRTAVLQHFASIEKDGYIKKDTLTKTAGRPVTTYIITDKGINYFPKQYAWFSGLILSDLQEEIGPERFKSYMQKLGNKMAENLRARFEGKSLVERRDELAAIMDELGYQIEKEADSDPNNLSIRALNCVYHDLALKHNELCDFDRALMSTLLGQEVKQLTCMAKGDCACSFRIKKNDEQRV